MALRIETKTPVAEMTGCINRIKSENDILFTLAERIFQERDKPEPDTELLGELNLLSEIGKYSAIIARIYYEKLIPIIGLIDEKTDKKPKEIDNEEKNLIHVAIKRDLPLF